MVAADIIEKVSGLSKIRTRELDGSTPLYNSAVISSLSLLDLMAHIEKKHGIVIRPEELVEDNFRDIQTLAQFVERKKAE